MVDRFRLHVRGGEGGSGCTSFRKSRHSRHGVADGTELCILHVILLLPVLSQSLRISIVRFSYKSDPCVETLEVMYVPIHLELWNTLDASSSILLLWNQ
jgi:hypothetical protein